MLLPWGLIRWPPKVLPCSHCAALVLAAVQLGGLCARSEADGRLSEAMATVSKGGSEPCGVTVSIVAMPPSRGGGGFVPVPGVLSRFGPGAMSALLISAVAAGGGKVPVGGGKTPDGVVEVEPRLVRSWAAMGVAAAGLAARVWVGRIALVLPINHCKAASSRP